jgi:hypothetical protein
MKLVLTGGALLLQELASTTRNSLGYFVVVKKVSQ